MSTVHAGEPRVVRGLVAALTPGEIVLSQGTQRLIYRGSDTREYRVCVLLQARAGVIRVIADGTVIDLSPGDCAFATGRTITAMPDPALARGETIVATFENERP